MSKKKIKKLKGEEINKMLWSGVIMVILALIVYVIFMNIAGGVVFGSCWKGIGNDIRPITGTFDFYGYGICMGDDDFQVPVGIPSGCSDGVVFGGYGECLNICRGIDAVSYHGPQKEACFSECNKCKNVEACIIVIPKEMGITDKIRSGQISDVNLEIFTSTDYDFTGLILPAPEKGESFYCLKFNLPEDSTTYSITIGPEKDREECPLKCKGVSE